MNWLALGLALLTGMTFAQDSPPDFAYAVPLELGAPAAFYEVELPQVVYEAVVREDLGDLRVLNSIGEVVPHAFLPQPTQHPQPAFLRPTLFPLRGDAGTSLDRLGLRVEAHADGTIVSISRKAGALTGDAQRLLGYLADLSAHKGSVRAIEIEPPPSGAPFTGRLSVEASDDLAQWRMLAREAPVLSLVSGEQRLERLRVEFAPQKAKYLRLSWSAQGTALELSALKVEPAQGALEAKRAWKSFPSSPSRDEPNEYRFELGGRFPGDRLRVRLPQANTVAAVEILTRAASSQPWRTIARATVYRLRQGEEEVESPSIVLAARPQRELLLRVDPKGGGIGAAPPTVEIGWVPQRLVFVARGEGPFRLAYGSRRAMPSAYPVETLVPGYGAEGDVGERARRAIQPARPGVAGVLAGGAALEERIDFKRLLLWGTLVLAVLLLAAMTWRLWRQVGGASGANPANEPKSDVPDSQSGPA